MSAVIVLTVGEVSQASPTDCSQTSDPILFQYASATLRDTRWGPIYSFQDALNDALVRCNFSPIAVDGVYGRQTRNAVISITQCEHYAKALNNSDVKNSGEITISLWKLLLPREPVPSVSQRAFVLVMSHEGTDYDEIEWNYGTADDKSGLTWGPFGATVGYGNEVRGILQLLDDNVLRTVFASDYSIIHRLLNSKPKDGYVVLKPVYLNDRHRERFGDAFVRLASIPSTRNAYDQHAYVSSDWFRPALGMLEELVSDSGADQSETDFAFFLDLAVHARVDKERLKTTLRAILNEEAKLGRKLSFGERRRLIGNSFAGFVNPRRKEDRIGRNVVYYVDAIGEANLSDLELRSWRMRTNRKASHVGLTDCSYSTDLE